MLCCMNMQQSIRPSKFDRGVCILSRPILAPHDGYAAKRKEQQQAAAAASHSPEVEAKRRKTAQARNICQQYMSSPNKKECTRDE